MRLDTANILRLKNIVRQLGSLSGEVVFNGDAIGEILRCVKSNPHLRNVEWTRLAQHNLKRYIRIQHFGMRNVVLRPLDVAVAIRLAQEPGASYARLADSMGIAPSQAHASVRRLQKARLLLPVRREANRPALLEFLEHGVRYAFPAEIGRKSPGIPTAYSGPPLADDIVSHEPLVWPWFDGTVEGDSLKPLYPNAVQLPTRCPELYNALTIVDAIRVGRARERKLAIARLRDAWQQNWEPHG